MNSRIDQSGSWCSVHWTHGREVLGRGSGWKMVAILVCRQTSHRGHRSILRPRDAADDVPPSLPYDASATVDRLQHIRDWTGWKDLVFIITDWDSKPSVVMGCSSWDIFIILFMGNRLCSVHYTVLMYPRTGALTSSECARFTNRRCSRSFRHSAI